jgi:hypothetical protein
LNSSRRVIAGGCEVAVVGAVLLPAEFQIPPDLVVKSQAVDMADVI